MKSFTEQAIRCTECYWHHEETVDLVGNNRDWSEPRVFEFVGVTTSTQGEVREDRPVLEQLVVIERTESPTTSREDDVESKRLREVLLSGIGERGAEPARK